MEYWVIFNVTVLVIAFNVVINLKIAIHKASTSSLKRTKSWIDDELRRREEL